MQLAVLPLERRKRTMLVTVDDDKAYHPDMLLALALAAANAPWNVALGFMCKQYDGGARVGPNLQREGSCPGWLFGKSGVLHRRSHWAVHNDDVYRFERAG